jgi:hypothetical protein
MLDIIALSWKQVVATVGLALGFAIYAVPAAALTTSSDATKTTAAATAQHAPATQNVLGVALSRLTEPADW